MRVKVVSKLFGQSAYVFAFAFSLLRIAGGASQVVGQTAFRHFQSLGVNSFGFQN